MKAKVTTPDGKTLEVDASLAELERLAATPGYVVQLVGVDDARPSTLRPARPFLYDDLRHPFARA